MQSIFAEKKMKKNLAGVWLLLILIFTITACSSSRKTIAVEEGWDLIAEDYVNFVKDKDVIQVVSNTPYTDIKIQAEKKDIVIKNFKIVYLNGDKLSPAIGSVLKAGETSNAIHLSPAGKIVRSIEFKYRSTGSILKGRGRVLIFGKRLYSYKY